MKSSRVIVFVICFCHLDAVLSFEEEVEGYLVGQKHDARVSDSVETKAVQRPVLQLAASRQVN